MNDRAPNPAGVDDALRRLEPLITRLATALALGAAVLLLSMAVITGEDRLLIQAAAAAVVGLFGAAQLVTGRVNAPSMLGATALMIVVAARLAGHEVAVGSAVALATIGILSTLYVRRRVHLFIGAFAVAIMAASVFWTGEVPHGLADGVGTAAIFIAGSIVLVWLQRQLRVDADRYRNLFDRAPVSIWEEDFTLVAEYLEKLRSRGIEDIESHLHENPEAIREAASLIRVRAVNSAAVELLEAESGQELIGALHGETLTDEAIPSLTTQLVAVWDGIDHIVTDLRGGRTVRGNPIEAIISWTATRVGDKLDLSRVIVAIVDVTEIRRTQARLRALLVSKDEFVASVSHELRTPLTAVVGIATELSEGLDRFGNDEVRELVDLMAGQAAEVSTIVDDLLAAARAEAGMLEVEPRVTNLEDEIAAVLRGMTLTDVATVDCVGSIYADPARLRQILRNLLVNAQRYGTEPIRIVGGDNGTMRAIEVRDAGRALADSEREAIFERYYRARQQPGVTASVGLGLTLSRDLARSMGGDLSYDHDGAEAIFRLDLPAPIPIHARSA